MKYSFSTLGCADWSLQQIIDYAKNSRFEAVEIRGINDEVEILKMKELQPENLPETKKLLDENGVKIVCISSSAAFHDPEKFEWGVAEGIAAVKAADYLGASCIRVFGNNVVDDTTIPRVAKGIQMVCDAAKDTKVQVCLEIHGEFSKAEMILEVARLVDRDNFGIVWDVGNNTVTCDDDHRVFYEQVKPLVKHVHFKDLIRATDKVVLPGEGDYPLPMLRDLLDEGGYTGFASLEWERKWHPEIETIDVAEKAFFAVLDK